MENSLTDFEGDNLFHQILAEICGYEERNLSGRRAVEENSSIQTDGSELTCVRHLEAVKQDLQHAPTCDFLQVAHTKMPQKKHSIDLRVRFS